jgi:hypothetical protein
VERACDLLPQARIMAKFFIFNSRPDKDWVPSDAMLVSTVARIHPNESHTDCGKEKYYPLPKRLFPDDIRR